VRFERQLQVLSKQKGAALGRQRLNFPEKRMKISNSWFL